jgi:hypothetical protein
MTHFENYRWEDHVPRKGSWWFDLATGVLLIGLIAATSLGTDNAGNASLLAAPATPKPGADMTFSAFDLPRRDVRVALSEASGQPRQCSEASRSTAADS